MAGRSCGVALAVFVLVSPVSCQLLRGSAEHRPHHPWESTKSDKSWTRSFFFHHDADGDHAESREVKTQLVRSGSVVQEQRIEVRCHDGDCEEVQIISPQARPFEAVMNMPMLGMGAVQVSEPSIFGMLQSLAGVASMARLESSQLANGQEAIPGNLGSLPKAEAIGSLQDFLNAFSQRSGLHAYAWSREHQPRLRHWAGELEDGPSIFKKPQQMPPQERDEDDNDDEDDEDDVQNLSAEMPFAYANYGHHFGEAAMVFFIASAAMAATTVFAIRACRCGSEEACERPLQALSLPLAESFSAPEEPLAQLSVAVRPKENDVVVSVETKVAQTYLVNLYERATTLAAQKVVQSYLAGLYDCALVAARQQQA